MRQQVTRDLEKIRSLKLENNPAWYGALLAGYKMISNREQADWAEAEQARRFPQPWPPLMTKWREGHPNPSPDDPPGKKREFYSELLEQTDEWIKARPNYPYSWGRRLEALANLEGTPAADILSAAEKYVRESERDAGPQGTSSYQYFSVASTLSKKHLAPERVLELANKAVACADAAGSGSDLNSSKEDQEFYKPYNWLQGTAVQIRALLDLKRTDEAAARLKGSPQRPCDRLWGSACPRRPLVEAPASGAWPVITRRKSPNGERSARAPFWSPEVRTRPFGVRGDLVRRGAKPPGCAPKLQGSFAQLPTPMGGRLDLSDTRGC